MPETKAKPPAPKNPTSTNNQLEDLLKEALENNLTIGRVAPYHLEIALTEKDTAKIRKSVKELTHVISWAQGQHLTPKHLTWLSKAKQTLQKNP